MRPIKNRYRSGATECFVKAPSLLFIYPKDFLPEEDNWFYDEAALPLLMMLRSFTYLG